MFPAYSLLSLSHSSYCWFIGNVEVIHILYNHSTLIVTELIHWFRMRNARTVHIQSPLRVSIYYRHPCVATVADYVLLLFIFIFIFYFFIFYSPFVLRNYSTDSHQIFRNCVFWCSMNNSVVLKFFGGHLAEKNAKNSKYLV